MDCSEVRERLTSYLDLELLLDDKQKIIDHLKVCSVCEKELNDLKKVGQWVHLTQADSDPYFEKQVLRTIRAGKSPGRGSSLIGHLTHPFWAFLLSPVIKRAALAFVFLLSVTGAYYLGYQAGPGERVSGYGIPQRDLEKINQEIDFYKDYEMLHQLDILKNMDRKTEEEKL